jgi:hypothetical protein
MTAQEIQTLRSLVEKWRERERKASTEAKAQRIENSDVRRAQYCEGKADSLNRCADELDTLLAHSPSETPQAEKCTQTSDGGMHTCPVCGPECRC